MLTYNQAFYELKNKLQPLYDEREAAAIAHEALHHITGFDKIQRLLQKEASFTSQQQLQYENAVESLCLGVPLQYVTGSAWFMGREYYVNGAVLIPRPETEELVAWILEDNKANKQPLQVLDIGTGSGCIPISLKLALPEAVITTCDISVGALEVAKKNAKHMEAEINFEQMDFLDTAQHNKLAIYDVIVSNPPYIPVNEKERIHTNVKDHEPGLALFVPSDDALVFYKAITLFGNEHLNSNGYIYCELDAGHAMDCKALFEQAGYRNVEIRKDMHGNWRMLRAQFG